MTRISLVVGAAALMGCFHDSLRDTCEQQGGCAGATGTSSSSATASPPTTGEGTSTGTSSVGDSDATLTGGTTGAPPGVPVDGVAFRITTIEFIDPHSFYHGLACADVTEFVNGELEKSIVDRTSNILLVARDYAPDAAFQEFLLYPGADCPADRDHCLLLGSVLPVTYLSVNKDEGDCREVEVSTLNPANVDQLNLPNAPCVASPAASVELQLTPNLSPIKFYGGRFSAEYGPGAVDPDSLNNAVLHGFVPKSEAELIVFQFGDTPINFWAAIRGSDHPESCPVPVDDEPGSVPDVDVLDLDGPDGEPPVAGVYLYLNFTAERVQLYAPL